MKTTDIKLKYKDHIQDPENLCNAFIHNVENDSLQVDFKIHANYDISIIGIEENRHL